MPIPIVPIFAGTVVGLSLANALLSSSRKLSRSEWLTLFLNWKAPSSNTESVKINSTVMRVRRAIDNNPLLSPHGIRIIEHGSSANNTNTRNRSDIDLVAIAENSAWCLPNKSGEYLPGFGYGGGTLSEQYACFRSKILDALIVSIGGENINIKNGNKAIKITTEREGWVDCDLLPAFRLLQSKDRASTELFSRPHEQCVAFVANDGTYHQSYPEQHLENGRKKNTSTGYRFKEIVRIIKKLKRRFVEWETLLTASSYPSSYEIECLVYNVPDHILKSGDLYDGVLGALLYIKDQLSYASQCNYLVQIHRKHSIYSHWADTILGGLTKPDQVDIAREFIERAILEIGSGD